MKLLQFFLHGLCQRSRAGGELQVSSMVSKLMLVPSGLLGQDLFTKNYFQILQVFSYLSLCDCSKANLSWWGMTCRSHFLSQLPFHLSVLLLSE